MVLSSSLAKLFNLSTCDGFDKSLQTSWSLLCIEGGIYGVAFAVKTDPSEEQVKRQQGAGGPRPWPSSVDKGKSGEICEYILIYMPVLLPKAEPSEEGGISLTFEVFHPLF